MSIDFINQLKEKNERAFKQLVEEYQNMVFRTCMGIIHNSDDADDVTQEVFIEAFNSIHKFNAESKISTWLYRIAINKSLNYIRDNKRTKFMQSIGLANSPDIPDEKNHLDQPEEVFQAMQRKQIMESAIDSLPKNQKAVFVLNKIDDLSYKEIAEVLEISLSSVESLLFRAKKNLQKKLIHCYRKSC